MRAVAIGKARVPDYAAFQKQLDSFPTLGEKLACVERQRGYLLAKLHKALADADGVRYCHAQDAKRLAWWEDLFCGVSKHDVERIAGRGWLPMEKAPKDGTPILGMCVHTADPYHTEDPSLLTTYGAHCEGLIHVQDGPQLLVWGGAYSEDDWEIPDWWFLSNSDFEIVANPVAWLPLPRYADIA